MLYVTIVLFALAAVGGAVILKNFLSKKEPPRNLVYAHGLLAATALVLLIIDAIQSPDHYPKVSLILFVIAALGGFYMFFTNMRKKIPPLSVAAIHALLALTGFVFLLLFVLT